MSFTHRNTQVGTNVNFTSVTITKPTGLAVGDLMIACISKDDDPGITPPSGWTELRHYGTTTGIDQRTWLGYKIATSADVSASTFAWTGDRENWAGSISAWIPSNGNPALVAVSTDKVVSGTTVQSNSITGVSDDDLLVGMATAARTDPITCPTGGYTVRGDPSTGTGNGDMGSILATAIESSGGGTRTCSFGGPPYDDVHPYIAAFSDIPETLLGSGGAAADGDAVLTVKAAYEIPYSGKQLGNLFGRPGPWYDPTSDTIYALFGQDAVSNWTGFRMVKSTNDGQLWNIAADASGSHTITHFATYHDKANRKILVAYVDTSNVAHYYQFDIATETWEVDHQTIASDAFNAADVGWDITKRATGEVIFFYRDSSPTDVIKYASRANLTPATTWSTAVQILDTNDSPVDLGVVPGDGDRIHFVYTEATSDVESNVTMKEDDSLTGQQTIGDGGWTNLYFAISSAVLSFIHGPDTIVYWDQYDYGDQPDSDVQFGWFVSADTIVSTGTEAEPPGWTTGEYPEDSPQNRLSFIRHAGGRLVHIAMQQSNETIVYQHLRQAYYDGGTYSSLGTVIDLTSTSSRMEAELIERDGNVYVAAIYRDAVDADESWYYEEQLVGTILVPLVGSGAAASDGDATLTIAADTMQGSGAAASAGTGALSKTQALTGTGAAASNGTGTITSTQALYGVGSAASDGDATLQNLIGITGVGSAASAGTGTLTSTQSLYGSGGAASNGTAVLTSTQALYGSGAAASAGTSTLTKTQSMFAVGAAASDGDSVLTNAGGTVAIAGVGSAAADGDSTLTRYAGMFGSGGAASDGDATLQSTQSLYGAGGAASGSTTSVLSGAQKLNGTGAAASDGDAKLSKTQALQGVGSAASDGTATVSNIQALQGSGGAAADGDATLQSVQSLYGSGGAAADGDGTVSSTQSLVGSGGAASDGDATLTIAGATNMLGVGSAAADGDATLSSTQGLVGSGGASADGAGVLSSTQALTGSGGAASDGDATLTRYAELLGSGGAASAGSATLSSTQSLYAVGSAAADGDATLSSTQSLYGSGGAAADGRAVLPISGQKYLYGSGGAAADGDATLTSTQSLYASGGAASDGDATITSTQSLYGSGGAASAGTATTEVAGQVFLTGAGEAASAGTATLSVTAGLLGVGSAASAGTGTLSDRLFGSGAASSTGNATLSRIRGIFGSGGAAADGDATPSGTVGLFASGAAVSDGDSTLNLTTSLYAVGSAAADGTATMNIVGTKFWVSNPVDVTPNPVPVTNKPGSSEPPPW